MSGPNVTTGNSGGTSIFNGISSSATRVFAYGNLKDTNKDGDPNDTTSADGNYPSSSVQSVPYDVNIGLTLDAATAFTNVLGSVGARWWMRDYDIALGNTNVISTNDIASYVDERLIHETITGTGKIMAWADDPFDDDLNEGVEWRALLALRADPANGAAPFERDAGWDSDADGMPDDWEIEHGSDPATANNNGDFDNNGYTDLEEYLNEIAAWPAPGEIVFTGETNDRYALIHNWRVTGVAVDISGIGNLATSSPWQPSRFDTTVISNINVLVDAVGQHAGTVRIQSGGTLDITNGWLDVTHAAEIGATSPATLNLSGGLLRAHSLTKGSAGAFNFTGGTLSAGVVDFDLVNQGGTIAPGASPGIMTINGSLTLENGSSLDLELGRQYIDDSDRIIVNGDLNLGGSLNVTAWAGFGSGTYTLINYTGGLSGSIELGSMPGGFGGEIDTGVPGEVRLVVSQQARFKSVEIAGEELVMNGSGPTNATFHLLQSSDLALPGSLWTPIFTNTFDGHGHFAVTNNIDPATPQTYFQLRLP